MQSSSIYLCFLLLELQFYSFLDETKMNEVVKKLLRNQSNFSA